MGSPSGLYGIVEDSTIAGQLTAAKNAEANVRGTRLTTGDDTPPSGEKIYVYNILDREYVVNQPPAFPAFKIPACPKGIPAAVTMLPRFVHERYERPGSVEYYYKNVDGRKYATSLLNPSAFPGVKWEAQLQPWRSTDQFGNNLNAWGVFWSMSPPLIDEDKLPETVLLLKQSPQLEKEIELFRARCKGTMNDLVRQAELLSASQQEGQITPNMHFAMDLLRRQAKWHMQSEFLIDCPTCGEPVKEGVAYHRNSMNFVCPVDIARCRELGIAIGPTTAAASDPGRAVQEPVVPVTVGLSAEEAEIEKAAAAGASREIKKTVAARGGKSKR